MKYTLKRKVEKPFFHSKNNIIIEGNDEFIELCGYSRNELIGKSLKEISYMLRIDSQIYLENIENEQSYYIFTKEYEAREVSITYKQLKFGNEKVYFFKEKTNSRIEYKFPIINKLLLDNQVCIGIYAFPNLTFLKGNQSYLDFLGKPQNIKENTIGKKVSDFVYLWEKSNFKELWMNVINTGKSFCGKEIKGLTQNCEEFYVDNKIIPVIENGKIKYIVSMIDNITKKVLLRNKNEEQAKVIKQQKEELDVIIQNMSDGLIIVDKDYNHSLLNSSAKEFVYNSDYIKSVVDDFVNTKYYDSHGNLLQLEDLPVSKVLKGEKIKEFRLTCNRPDGIYHFNVSGSPVYNSKDGFISAIIIVRDVTERVNKDELIREQKEKLEAIIKNMSDSLIFFDKYGKFTKLNKPAEDSFLFKVIKTKDIEDGFKKHQCYDEDGNLILKENGITKRILQGEKISDYKMDIKADDKLMHVEISGAPIYDNKGDFNLGIIITRDVTDKVKSEEALLLKTQLDLLNNMIKNLNIGYVRYSYPEFKIIETNNKSYNDLKQINPKVVSISSVKGNNYFDLFFPKEKNEATEIIQQLKGNKNTSYFSRRKIIVYGEEKFLKLLHQPLFGLNNQIVEVVDIAIDITDEVKVKNKIKQALKMQQEVFANVSHELKTPLNVIYSSTQLMEFCLKTNKIEVSNEKLLNNISIIKQNCYRFTKLINNIVDLSKIESGFLRFNLSNENIVQITEDIVQSVSQYVKSKGLSIIFDTNIEEKIIAFDPEKIERIILNLISNAIKFSNSGGEIFVSILNKGDTVEISVKDTGIGIDEKHLHNIFRRFYQVDKSLSRNTEGSGIGLSLVKSIVELHGGKISVESEVGHGTIFNIKLPARTVESLKITEQTEFMNDKIQMINIEFSDIYSK